MIQTINAENGTYLLGIPDNCQPGTWEAAKAFDKVIAELRAKRPGLTFDLLPFASSQAGLYALMAVATSVPAAEKTSGPDPGPR